MYQTETRQDSKAMTAFPVHDEAHDAFMTLPPYSEWSKTRAWARRLEGMVQTTAFGPLCNECSQSDDSSFISGIELFVDGGQAQI